MTAPIPAARPNPLRTQLLGELVNNHTITRIEIRGKFDKKALAWVENTIPVAVPALAGHVSELNVERAARRWGK